MNSIRIEIAGQFSDNLLDAIVKLLPQLSSSSRPLTAPELEAMLACPAVHLLVAKDGEEIVGMLSVIIVQIPTGLRAILEDLAVDNAYRRRGIGTDLMNAARDLADRAGAKTIDLTSRPSREAGIRIYGRLGYERRETNVFRLTLPR